MSYQFYKVLHLCGLSLVVLSLGGVILHVINGGTKSSNAFRKGAMITHGLGLLFLLVGGFGLLAKLGIHSFPGWVTGKLLIWLALGGLVAVAYKKPASARVLWVVVPVLVVVASYLAVFKELPGAETTPPAQLSGTLLSAPEASTQQHG